VWYRVGRRVCTKSKARFVIKLDRCHFIIRPVFWQEKRPQKGIGLKRKGLGGVRKEERTTNRPKTGVWWQPSKPDPRNGKICRGREKREEQRVETESRGKCSARRKKSHTETKAKGETQIKPVRRGERGKNTALGQKDQTNL